jgi:hypothetical protein
MKIPLFRFNLINNAIDIKLIFRFEHESIKLTRLYTGTKMSNLFQIPLRKIANSMNLLFFINLKCN